MNKQDITIVVVSYYRADRLKRCLDTLKDMPNIIVWDNNTTGLELDKIKELQSNPQYSNVDFIFSADNVGLPRAWNQGIIRSKTDWVLMTCDDMLFDDDWFDILNDILIQKPQLEQIHLNAWNAVVFHKQTVVRMGWWDERYRYYPSMEDDDWYLRSVECLGYSPYGSYAQHIPFSQGYLDQLKPFLDKKQEWFHDTENFTYYCNSDYSNHKVIGRATITGQEEDAGSRNNAEGSYDRGTNMTGVQFHYNKWQPILDATNIADEGVLLAKDGRLWKRVLDDVDFYPQQRAEYAKKYFNIDLTYTDEN